MKQVDTQRDVLPVQPATVQALGIPVHTPLGSRNAHQHARTRHDARRPVFPRAHDVGGADGAVTAICHGEQTRVGAQVSALKQLQELNRCRRGHCREISTPCERGLCSPVHFSATHVCFPIDQIPAIEEAQ